VNWTDDRIATSVSLLYRDRDGKIDGIGDYCERLEVALQAAGVDARTVAWRSHGIPVVEGSVILQYNPFSFGRWGFAPRLLIDMMSLRLRRPAVLRAVMVHEAFVPIDSAKSLVMGAWQRLQLRALLSVADVVMVSTSSWVRLLPAGTRPVVIPAGSNLPDRRGQRDSRRRSLAAGDGALVLASFGTDHPSRLLSFVVAAANAVVSRHDEVKLLCLGAGTRPLDGLDPRVELHRPGRQSDEELAASLSAADVYLAAFSDGVSTRRTTFVAALQHALPVVGTDGWRTEAELRRETLGIRWVPAGDPESFVDAVLALAGDAELRRRYGASARALYDREFSWEFIARRVVTALATPSFSSGPR
jgi:glycosyltransferase involved in cell wall biosynthesis